MAIKKLSQCITIIQSQLFTIFIPSRRSIEFFQKNIRQLIVEFIEKSVVAQMSNNIASLTPIGGFDMLLQIDFPIAGKEQMKKQPTANEHVEIFFKFLSLNFLASLIAKCC